MRNRPSPAKIAALTPPLNPELVARLLAACVREGDCLVYQGRHHHFGYGIIAAEPRRTGPDNPPLLTHHIAYVARYGPIPTGRKVLHTCDNPPCVEAAHLYAGTSAENSADMVRRRRNSTRVGESNPNAVLTDLLVRAIMQRLAAGESQRSIARSVGVHASRVWEIAHGRAWRHLTPPDPATAPTPE